MERVALSAVVWGLHDRCGQDWAWVAAACAHMSPRTMALVMSTRCLRHICQEAWSPARWVIGQLCNRLLPSTWCRSFWDCMSLGEAGLPTYPI
jgi:hypothetical protein